jgi:hypothetical protein
MFDDDLNRAIDLSESGENLEARKILEMIVQADPKIDMAWIWLANTYAENSGRIAVIKEWLKRNPTSQNAKDWLATYEMKENGKGEKSQEGFPDYQSSQVLHYQGDETIPDLVRRSDRIRYRRLSNKNKRPFLVPALAVGLFLLAGLGYLGMWMAQKQGAPSSPIIVVSPSSSPPTQFLSSSSTPSLASTPVPSSTASPSSTLLPAFTETPSLNTAAVNIDRVYLYAGPSTDHVLILCQGGNCIYPRGTQAILLAKHGLYGDTWFLVTMPDGKSGWLNEAWLQINGNPDAIPTASAYPTYPASPTP